MSVPTAAFSAQSHLLPQSQMRSMLPYLALFALVAPNISPGVAPRVAPSPPVLPSAFVPEAALYQLKPVQRPTRHVTAEESRILRLAILASSEIIDEGELLDT
jgi:hypothetical protein